MKQIMLDLCKQLNGHNFTEYENDILFDFYNTTGNAIFTMTCRNNQIQLADDVEYYATEIDYTNLTLREYEDLIGEETMNNDLICPYCKYTNEESNFPDLFYEDSNNDLYRKQQLQTLKELQALGYNIVTCGDCGQVFIQKW